MRHVPFSVQYYLPCMKPYVMGITEPAETTLPQEYLTTEHTQPCITETVLIAYFFSAMINVVPGLVPEIAA